MKEKLITAIADMNEHEAMSLAREMLDKGEDPQAILDAGSKAMALIGDRYDAGEYFLPELILAGDMMKQLGKLVKPKLGSKTTRTKPSGKVVIGTVAGDIHDIGKDVVAFMHIWPFGHCDLAGLGVEGLAAAVDFNIDLGTADVEEGIVDDFAFKAEPSFEVEVGINDGDFLADFHFHFGGGAVIGFEVGEDFGRFEIFSIHLSRRRAMGQGYHCIMRISGIIQENGPVRDMVQQDAGGDDDEV